jgi:hypothetical protein
MNGMVMGVEMKKRREDCFVGIICNVGNVQILCHRLGEEGKKLELKQYKWHFMHKFANLLPLFLKCKLLLRH